MYSPPLCPSELVTLHFMRAATTACTNCIKTIFVKNNIHLGVDALEVSVCLPCAHEDDGLPADVGHGDGGAHLIINSVKLCENYPVTRIRVVTWKND